MKMSKKFKKMCEIYLIFAPDNCPSLTYTEADKLEMYEHESNGGPISQTNGFYWAKKWLNVTVAMWREDLQKGFLAKIELYEDPKLPHWWLDSVLN